MITNIELNYDTLIIGGGIAGQEAALNLTGMGYKVLLVEKDLSIGGKMIQLSKVFPTLDCAACITTPKMSETARHPDITLLLNSKINNISKKENSFKIDITKKARYVIPAACIGCQLCEFVCPQIIKDQYNLDMVGRKAIYIPFDLANPRIAAIDIENCIHCKRCVKACPADAIDFSEKDEDITVNVKSVLIASGFKLFNPSYIKEYGYDKFANVIDALQMDRLIAPTRPFNYIVRPGDGKVPDNIAYVLCTGSRDSSLENHSHCSNNCSNNPICSQICCMYSIKQAQLLMGSLPLADITIYYIDIRAFGKAYEEFFQQAKSMGVNFIKGKIAKIKAKDNNNGDLIIRYEDIAGGVIKESKHDLVVLAAGVLPNNEISSAFTEEQLQLDDYNFINQNNELTNPSLTNLNGVFVAGTASGPKDIPDSILSAGCAAAEINNYLKKI
ncbi:MAG: CoB--CoM heterodisulfide reductase iron-sulfur subunit A family protein [Bacteroidales bacterium]|nr:CoB--CoM heterodisulfide reductase iron-sulfur subunit A family protein [Bacteroidales bacterium]